MAHVEQFHQEGQGIIFAFWHGRQLMMPLAYRGKKVYVLISHHRDGELIHRLIQRFGFHSVRGSTTRGGGMAFRKLIGLAKGGGDIGVTPDGPKGPKEIVKLGVIRLAKRSGLPIVPVTFACSKKKLFSSWDGFILPYPLSKGVFVCGAPIWVKAEANAEELEATRHELEKVLIQITREADAEVM